MSVEPSVETKKLSKKNYDKLDTNFLYRRKPIEGGLGGTYHCRNWTFKVNKYNDGKAYFNDTYFGDGSIEVTDKNIKEYKKIFDFREVKRARDYEYDEYLRKDVYRVATDSGGYSCGNLYWVKKDAKKSIKKLIAKKKGEIRSAKWQLELKEKDLADLITRKEERHAKGCRVYTHREVR